MDLRDAEYLHGEMNPFLGQRCDMLSDATSIVN